MKNFLNRLTPFQATVLLVIGTTLMRLVAAGSTELTTDEAHYALFGLHLDWSYFDHPSLIGWLQAIVLLFSDSDLALRVVPILLFSAASLVLYRVSMTLFPRETPWLGFVSVALVQSAVMLQLIGLAMLPDGPLLLLGLLVALVLHRVLSDGSLRYWLWLGLLLGLAGLSKYTAISLVITVLLALSLSRQMRQLRTPGPWLALMIAMIVIMPVLYWNYCHDWISFLYQIHHGTGKLGWEFKRVLVSQAGQLFVYGPGVYFFGMIAAVAGVNELRKSGVQAERGVMLCLALALPLLLLFGWNSGYEMTLPHWTSFGWVALSPLAARWIIRSWNKRWVRVSVRSSTVYAVLFIGVVFSQLISPWIPFPENKNFLRDLYGWGQAAKKAEQLRAGIAATAGTAPLIFTENWTLASRLSWYARPTPVQVLDTRYNQFDIWFGSPQNGARGILVLWPDENARPGTGGSGQFASCTLRDRLPILVNARLTSTFSFYACDDYKN
ncbi:MAG TPA: glycosyltransferase family 39 protein [Gallionellaceae bacterium]|nr:glycosyltransferase family 39 protein [Gallionellaceae bacterium]